MSNRTTKRTADRWRRSTIVAAFVIVGAAVGGVLGYPSAAPSSSATPPPIATERPAHRPPDNRHSDRGPTVLDEDSPTVANLDSDLLSALRRVAADAAGDGVKVHVRSGWRSRDDQERLFRDAVSKYGSAAEAARWVAMPGTSAHESGDAIDVGPSAAATWLSGHGASYGLCPIYRNEPWHFELRRTAVDHGCPPLYPDPTHDPRMQQ